MGLIDGAGNPTSVSLMIRIIFFGSRRAPRVAAGLELPSKRDWCQSSSVEATVCTEEAVAG